jgi:histidyl-tRNA synthetase
MATSDFARLPGFRDFPPEEFALRRHIQESWRRIALRYGFAEYDGAVLEPLELYVEKSGEEIVGQLFNFVDKGDRSVTLRPEMTPSLARILGDRSRGMSKPIRWFSMPQLYRYERMQRGRLREHFQWNVDIVGEAGVAADAEVLAVAIDGLRELGLTSEDFVARVSDRRLLSALLGAIGIPQSANKQVFGVVDKIERLPQDKAEKLLADAGLTADQISTLRELLDDPDVDKLEARFGPDSTVAPEIERLKEYISIVRSMGLGDFLSVDLRIVRGLAYYTGIVFELFDRKGELRAICGGGRYDRLLELVGGEPLPAVGFGMGDVVLEELLRDRDLIPEYSRSLDYFIVPVEDAQREEAMRVAHLLRDAGHSVGYALRSQGVGKQMKVASREGAATVLVLGPDEVARGCARARDMSSGEERDLPLSELG